MIDQVEVERFKLQILAQIQDEELTNGTAVIEIPAGSEPVAAQALYELNEVLQNRNIKTVLIPDQSRPYQDRTPSPLNPKDAACVLSVAFSLVCDHHAALVNIKPQTVREAFIKLAMGLYSKMSPAEFEKFMQENFPS